MKKSATCTEHGRVSGINLSCRVALPQPPMPSPSGPKTLAPSGPGAFGVYRRWRIKRWRFQRKPTAPNSGRAVRRKPRGKRSPDASWRWPSSASAIVLCLRDDALASSGPTEWPARSNRRPVRARPIGPGRIHRRRMAYCSSTGRDTQSNLPSTRGAVANLNSFSCRNGMNPG